MRSVTGIVFLLEARSQKQETRINSNFHRTSVTEIPSGSSYRGAFAREIKSAALGWSMKQAGVSHKR